jgi:hypothetical protein
MVLVKDMRISWDIMGYHGIQFIVFTRSNIVTWLKNPPLIAIEFDDFPSSKPPISSIGKSSGNLLRYKWPRGLDDER